MPFAASGKCRKCRQAACAMRREISPAAHGKALNRLQIDPRVSNSVLMLVGAERFELPTPCSQNRCATRLRYAPTSPHPYSKEIPLGKLLVHDFADFLACIGERVTRKPWNRQLRTRDDQLEEFDVVPEDMFAGFTHSRPSTSQRFRSFCPQATRKARPGSAR